MSSLFILIPIAVVFVVAAVGIFFWAVNSGQFDDLEGPAHKILFEEPTATQQKVNKTAEQQPNQQGK